MKFFAAKTLYIWEVRGKSKVKHKPDSQHLMIEERIVLVKAANFDKAISKAEKEAKNYESTYTNPYKQKVKIKYMNCIDVYELFDEKMDDLVEIYSITNLIRGFNIRKILDANFGSKIEQEKEKRIRIKYSNIDFSWFKD